ncbi:rab5 GDP/GTP exchange factor-like isoform X2 [Hyla sarda]|uniref:rab5 GDP/GTP exchange factor-like isoform X2 n=1 Tax=Hyla sarda TaxID=327740 RepID=UPI0024C38551|nr:rab5 GDP/GTP exchange factor-like isoform X2 [Hyla sarda]
MYGTGLLQIMSFTSPGHKAIPFHQDQNLPHNASLQFQGFLYQGELCRKNCGFYGNPAWHGYCSRCWIQHRQQARPLTDGFRHQTGNLQVKPDVNVTTQLLHRKDTLHDVTNNNVQSGQATSILYQTATGSVSHFSRSCLLSLAGGDFSQFLKALRSPEAQPLLTCCNNFIQRMQEAETMTVDEKAEEVQTFYQQIVLYYPDHMSDEGDRLLDNTEKLVMTRLHQSVFCLNSSQDEQKDLALQKRIKSLSWVTQKMLQLPLVEEGEEVENGISCAIISLIEMDSKRAPQDKLTCVSKACNSLYKSIQISKKEPATADDLLSCLVYSTLKANPPRLWSNLQYITRFCNPKRLTTGVSGYYFTNLCCAASFIETLEASSLGLTREEFNRLMQGSDGTTFISSSSISTLQQIERNKELLGELQQRQDILFQKATCLGKEVEAWPLSVQRDIQEIIRRFPLDSKASPRSCV